MAPRRSDLTLMLSRAKALPARDQAALIEALLTPALRMRLIVGEIRSQSGPRDERKIDAVVDRAVRKVRTARAARR